MIDEAGSVVQITIENGRLDGYVSKLLDGQTSSLTYFFDRTTLDGDRLTFTTKQIHGSGIRLTARSRRRVSQSRQQDGYYRLKGAWLTHDEVQKSQSNSTVSLKSTPRRD